MTELIIKQKIYLYGKGLDESEKAKKNFVTIYVAPKIFDKVRLSSLEGFFVMGERDLSDFVPRISFKRNQMSNIEKKYSGRFILFSDY